MKRSLFLLLFVPGVAFCQTTLLSGTAIPVPIASGGTASSTIQAAIDTLTHVYGGSNTYVLTDTGTGLQHAVWAAAGGGGGGMTNPMTTLGDIIYGGTAGAATRLAGNTNNYFEMLGSTASGGVAAAPAWSTFVTDYGVSTSFFAGGAGSASTTGIHNVLIGDLSGGGITTGGNNTIVGYNAYPSGTSSNGTSVGSFANGSDYGAAVGYNANGSSDGAAVGYYANGSSDGAAVGYNANGSSYGAAVGAYVSGSSDGAAVGYNANGSSYGAAVGFNANGSSDGAAVGYYAKGSSYGTAVGYYAGHGLSATNNYNIALGSYCEYSADTATHSLFVGGNQAANQGVSNGYFGDGDMQASGVTPDNFTLHATGGNGTNIVGAQLAFASGIPTGNAASPAILLKASLATTSGTTPQTLVTIHSFDTGGEILSAQTAIVIANATTLSGQAEFYEVPSNAGTSVAVTAPAGTTGRIIIVENKDATAATTGMIVPALTAYKFIYDGSAWIHVQ